MSVEEAKTRLETLRGQITNHNTNIKKYTEKKTEVLKILGEINGLIEKIKSTVGENSEAKKNLDHLIRLVKDIPQIDQELKDNELVDLLGILQGVKKKLEDIVGGPPSNLDADAPEFTPAAQQGETKGGPPSNLNPDDGYESEEEITLGGSRKRGGFKFTSNAIKSRKSRFMTRKRKSKSPKRQKRTRRKRRKRKGRKSRRKRRR